MAQKAKAPGSPGDEAPCKLQKCSTGDFVAERQAAHDVPDAALIAEVQSVLVDVDLNSMTLGELRARLEGNLGLTDGALSARKRIRRRLSFVVQQEVLKKSQRSQQCEKVIKELLKLDDYPLPARQMLVESLHHSVSTNGAPALHPHQVRLLGIAQDALLHGKSKLEAIQSSLEESLQLAEAELVAKETAATVALESAAAAKRRAQSSEALAKDIGLEVLETEKELERKQQHVKKVLEDTSRHEQLRRLSCEAASQLRRLAEGAWANEEEWWECFAALQQHLLDTGAENSLLTAATVSLKKRPQDRSSFDGIAVEGVDGFFREQLAANDEQLAQQSRLEMEAEANVLGIEALLNATKLRGQQQQEVATDANALKELTESASTAAQSARENCKTVVAQKQQEQVNLEARLATMNEAVELLGAWIAGSALPATEEPAEPSPPQQVQVQDVSRSPIKCKKMAADTGMHDDSTAILRDINSPLRVPTPMKGRM